MEIAAPATDLARRRFLKTAAIAGTGLVAATVAACTTGVPRWTERPLASGGAPTPTPPATPSATPAASATPMPGMSPTPAPSASPGGMAEHDKAAEAVVKRFPEKTDVVGNQPLEPSIDGDWKVFELSCSAVKWQIDAVKDPVDAVAFNGMVPGPIIRVTEGDQVRVHVRNDLAETTGIHWHGVEVPNPMDGVPFVTQPPIMPGETFTYEFVATPSGSQMYHSHHNATDQVGRGLLGAFLIEPADAKLRYDVDHDVVWISNDALGGFTINGKGFPATAPIVARKGERILVRFMNEGVMMHPWHLHGMPMRVVARDGYPLGGAAFTCDTLGVNPGERWDVIIEAKHPGVWAFHCHILPHAEGKEGMFGMVTALIVQE